MCELCHSQGLLDNKYKNIGTSALLTSLPKSPQAGLASLSLESQVCKQSKEENVHFLMVNETAKVLQIIAVLKSFPSKSSA